MQQHHAQRVPLARLTTTFFFVLVAAFLAGGLSQVAQAQTYKVIYNFTDKGEDGATPYGGPILDRDGNLYGTTSLGGTFGAGTVYKLSPVGSSWKHSSLYSFFPPNGSGPAFGSLAVFEGAMYGTTEGGLEFGTVFKVGPCESTCQGHVVHRFGYGVDGAEPVGGVVFDKAGALYGTTLLNGAYGYGAVFEVTAAGVEKVIYSFVGGTDAANPPAGVTVGAQGNLFGTSSFGGANGVGAIYELSRSGSGWSEKILYNFQGLNDGQNPVGGVILDDAGNIYGGTFDGGVNGGGTVYELSPSAGGWTFTTLYSFIGGYGGPYNKLTFDAKGNLYGILNGESAFGLGSVFKLTPGTGGWTYTDLYDFPGGAEGGLPYSTVAVDTEGNVFGTAVVGGSDNQGVVFEITP